MTPLYHHTSQDTAYIVSDYPYGSLRCQIRFWLEHKEGRGYRFVSQTENPKTGKWNKPKASTYARLAACMYLDEKGHTTWAGLGEYSSASDVRSFIERFPGAVTHDLTVWCVMKRRYAEKGAAGEIVWTINGVARPVTPSDIEDYQKDVEAWKACTDLLRAQGKQ